VRRGRLRCSAGQFPPCRPVVSIDLEAAADGPSAVMCNMSRSPRPGNSTPPPRPHLEETGEAEEVPFQGNVGGGGTSCLVIMCRDRRLAPRRKQMRWTREREREREMRHRGGLVTCVHTCINPFPPPSPFLEAGKKSLTVYFALPAVDY